VCVFGPPNYKKPKQNKNKKTRITKPRTNFEKFKREYAKGVKPKLMN
jgi:hypothetical protein